MQCSKMTSPLRSQCQKSFTLVVAFGRVQGTLGSLLCSPQRRVAVNLATFQHGRLGRFSRDIDEARPLWPRMSWRQIKVSGHKLCTLCDTDCMYVSPGKEVRQISDYGGVPCM